VNLAAERLNRGLSLPKAAALIGVARGTLMRAERGEGVQAESAKRIADFYEVQVTDIWPVEERAA